MQCTPLNVQFEEANNDSAMDLELSKWISNATTQKKKIATNLPPGVHDNDDEDHGPHTEASLSQGMVPSQVWYGDMTAIWAECPRDQLFTIFHIQFSPHPIWHPATLTGPLTKCETDVLTVHSCRVALIGSIWEYDHVANPNQPSQSYHPNIKCSKSCPVRR